MQAAQVSRALALVPTDHHSLSLGSGILSPKPPSMCLVTLASGPGQGRGEIPSRVPPQVSEWFQILGIHSTDVDKRN